MLILEIQDFDLSSAALTEHVLVPKTPYHSDRTKGCHLVLEYFSQMGTERERVKPEHLSFFFTRVASITNQALDPLSAQMNSSQMFLS